MYYDKKAAWTASLSVIFCGVSIAVLQNKVVPCLDAIQAEFSLSNATGGWLSSLFSVTGIVMAFPAALIVGRFGVKRTLCELGIGTNYAARLTGVILEDEKAYQTVHIAFGTNIGFGGTNKADCHIDGIIKNPTLYLDDVLVLKDGAFQI